MTISLPIFQTGAPFRETIARRTCPSWNRSARQETPMSDAHPHDQEAPEVALARHVDAICRRFEADWRSRPEAGDRRLPRRGRRGGPTDPARRARGPRERAAPGGRGGDRRTGEFAHFPDPGPGETLGPRGSHRGAPRSGHGRSRITQTGPARCLLAGPRPLLRRLRDRSARSPAAAWASSSRPGRSASTGPSR